MIEETKLASTKKTPTRIIVNIDIQDMLEE
jgi:hypothetical protein